MYFLSNLGKNRYSVKIWKCFLSAFVYIPIAALVGGRILCMHGGLSPEMHQISDIDQIRRPQ